MNYKIRKNEELANFNYLCKTFVAALHTNKSSFVLKVGTIHMLSIYQFFPQIDQFHNFAILANQTKTICFSSRELEFT